MKLILAISLLVNVSAFAQVLRKCPVLLVGATSSKDGITIRMRNKGKLPISRIELNCVVRGRLEPMRCGENTPMFYPGTDYTATFYYPRQPRSVSLSIKQLAMSGGTIYTPHPADHCQTLAIAPPKNVPGHRR